MIPRMKYLLLVAMIVSCRPDVQENKVLSKRFRLEEKKYFIETSVYPTLDLLRKWDKPLITYTIVGSFKNRDVAFIKRMVQNAGLIRSIPKLKYVKSDADITFNMPANPEEVWHYGHSEKIGGITLARSMTMKWYFDKVEILVVSNVSPMNTQVTIMHEFVHSLGLFGHPDRRHFNESSALGIRFYDESFMGADTISPILPQLDKAALEILYNKSVQVRMRRREISDLLGMKK